MPFNPESISNMNVDGLGDELVPLEASRVRICAYRYATDNVDPHPARLHASGLRTGTGASRLRDEMNGLERLSGPNDGGRLPACSAAKARAWFLLTSGGDSATVVVSRPGCPYFTNNVLSAALTPQLAGELTRSVVTKQR